MNTNPRKKAFGRKARASLSTVERIDETGRMYRMQYLCDHTSAPFRLPFRVLDLVSRGGCSAFLCRNEAGNYLVGRNYDLPHLDSDGVPTGCNMFFPLESPGCYRSLNFCDAVWLSMLGTPIRGGSPDDGSTDISFLMLLPYLTMDGMNEKGFTVSILALDLREGEKAAFQKEKGRPSLLLNVLLRRMLDTCATVEEAVELAKRTNVRGLLGHDYHLFAADATGDSAVLEWRHDTLTVTRTDACTNFYMCADDAEDSYLDGRLREAWTGPAATAKEYHYGYGHGYERFKTVARTLDSCPHDGDGHAILEADDAARLLSAVVQAYTGDTTSQTQYSVVYDLTARTAEVTVQEGGGKTFRCGPFSL